ncbi:MAG: sll0787 family AIR synthase-like protein [Cyanobacteria bacterium J06634_6]
MLTKLTTHLQSSLSILHKQDIQTAADSIGQYAQGLKQITQVSKPIRLGDDCAAIPDGDGYLLLASEGIWPQLVDEDPWFAGWCAVMVNISDIAAMGGYPVAMVDALWSKSLEDSRELWAGMQAASAAYGVPIVGGHTNCHSPYAGLSVSILGRAERLITSFDAEVGDRLVMVVNMAGAYRRDYPFWNAATTAEPQQLRNHLQLLPQLAQSDLVSAGKDISMGGLAGTLVMLAEASNCGALLNLEQIPRPAAIPWKKWLTSFPSFGFLLSVPSDNVTKVQQIFHPHGLACEAIGEVTAGHKVCVQHQGEQSVLWDLAQPLTGFGA